MRNRQPDAVSAHRNTAVRSHWADDPKRGYTEEERELFREIARLKGTLQRLNNYFGGRQYREVFEENQALINELKKILSR